MENSEQQQQQQGSKVKNKYEINLKKLKGILYGNEKLLEGKDKVDAKDALTEIILEITQEKNATAKEKIKKDLLALLERHVDFNKQVKIKEKELEKLKDDKMKEFNDAAEALFSSLSNIDEHIRELTNSLKTAMGDEPVIVSEQKEPEEL